MKKLHTFGLSEKAFAGMLKELLEREGIPCLLRNDQLFAALGEIPFTECFPELWVIDDEVWPRAKSLMDGWFSQKEGLEPWRCSNCGELLEGQFDSCWQCGETR